MATLQETLDRHVRDGTAPGVVAALGYADGRLDVAAAGNLTLNSIVRIQSMTKAVTTVATLRLVDRDASPWPTPSRGGCPSSPTGRSCAPRHPTSVTRSRPGPKSPSSTC